jgi:hypothetical protein
VPIEIIQCKVSDSWTDEAQTMTIAMQLEIDGKSFSVEKSKILECVATERQRLGTIDLLESCMQDALRRYWPEMPEKMPYTLVRYQVTAAGTEDSHEVYVFLYVRNEEEKENWARWRGSDSIRGTAELMAVVYSWVLWRMRRADRGAQRRKAGK